MQQIVKLDKNQLELLKQCWSLNFFVQLKKQILVDNDTFILPVM